MVFTCAESWEVCWVLDATLVTVHGLFSSTRTWDRLTEVWCADEELRGLRVHHFNYPSPRRPRTPFSWTSVPGYADIAQTLATEYAHAGELADVPNIIFVTHSQGGLILQRFLWWMVDEGRARELSRIRSVVMLACPNDGSEYLRSLRRLLGFRWHPQARNLDVLHEDIKDTQRTVLARIVNASTVDDHQCAIPFHVYAGNQDRIVGRASAQSAFPGASTTSGNHFTILDPAGPGNRTADIVKRHLLADLDTTRRPAESAYLEQPYLQQVRQIAPNPLRDREPEWAELAEFCDGDEFYVWWQGDAWSGKTALTSWFVLHPPENVDVVSFFVTGTWSTQADSTAFTEALLRQLAHLTGAPSTRDAHLLDLLRLAAQRPGRRLVLLVDGLDEDHSRQADGRLPSIAALLPRPPIDGLRIIVTSRPNPEIPGDVPDDHPLRPARVRWLAQSVHASDIARQAKEELRRLLHAGALERNLLGLVTATEGGLTTNDLVHLTGMPPYQVDDLLSGVTGRTFTRRLSHWTDSRTIEVFHLAHTGLQAEAERALGEGELAGLRKRLHTWADEWRSRGWPPETPPFLLDGYGKLLQRTKETARLVTLAADGTRLDRMLDLAGSDADAFTELDTAIDSAARAGDLGTLTPLCFQRDRLVRRNRQVSPGLPAAWARAGWPERAERLARSFSGTSVVQAMAWTTIALRDTGVDEAAQRLLEQAGKQLEWIVDLPGFPDGAGAVAAAYARAGDPARAAATLERISAVGVRNRHLVEVVAAMAVAGDVVRADAMAVGVESVMVRVQAIAGVVQGLVRAGKTADADRCAASAVELAGTVDPAAARDMALTAAARAQAMVGKTDDAVATVGRIEDVGKRSVAFVGVAATIADPEPLLADADTLFSEAERTDEWFRRASATPEIAQAYAGTGRLEAAMDLAREEASTHAQVECLLAIAEKLGQTDDAVRVLTEAERIARGGSGIEAVAEDLLTAAWALISAGAPAEATELLEDLEAVAAGPLRDEVPLRNLTRAVDAAKAHGREDPKAPVDPWKAVAQAGDLEPEPRDHALADVARDLAQSGELAGARQLADGIENLWWRAAALAWVADAAPEPDILNVLDGVLTEAEQAEHQARETRRQDNTGGIHLELPTKRQSKAAWAAAETFAHAGQTERAQRAANMEPHPKSGQRAHEKIAVCLAEAGYVEEATELAMTGISRSPRAVLQGQVAVALHNAGRTGKAQDLLVRAMMTGTWDEWASALAAISKPSFVRLTDVVRAALRSALEAQQDPHRAEPRVH